MRRRHLARSKEAIDRNGKRFFEQIDGAERLYPPRYPELLSFDP